jgi:formamidopyrimidine-DNA glycosylase
MPELPEVQAHVERLDAQFAGRVLRRFVPLNFTVLKTATPRPDEAYGEALRAVERRGKYLLLQFPSVRFAVHLMQGGRLLVDEKQSAKPRNGRARFVFDDGPALLLTEAGTERKAGVWCMPPGDDDTVSVDDLLAMWATQNMRLHGWLRDQHHVAALGRMLANEICHRAKLSPFAMTGKLGLIGAEAVHAALHAAVDEGLIYERTRSDMSSSADRPGLAHGRIGAPCLSCEADTIRSVSYSGYTVAYCPTCQTGGKPLADNTTSKFLK